MPVYRITHQTTYRHGAAAGAAWQMVQLHPRTEPGQECLEFHLDLTPPAPDLSSRADYFGNLRHYFSVRQPHRELAITSQAVVRREAPVRPDPASLPTVTAARADTQTRILAGTEYGLAQYLAPTPLVPFLPGSRALAAGLDPDQPVLDWIEELGRRFTAEFAFDPTATDISTPLAEVLEKRRGVCQDFTHFFLSCLRQEGLPAAYVSGYLLTHPPPGQPRLRGADAMHAWVAVHVPGGGWIDYDPTNACFPGDAHIVVARGRDYADVSPNRGVFTGSQTPLLSLGVTVEPTEAEG